VQRENCFCGENGSRREKKWEEGREEGREGGGTEEGGREEGGREEGGREEGREEGRRETVFGRKRSRCSALS